jgi:hypothetical protein
MYLNPVTLLDIFCLQQNWIPPLRKVAPFLGRMTKKTVVTLGGFERHSSHPARGPIQPWLNVSKHNDCFRYILLVAKLDSRTAQGYTLLA